MLDIARRGEKASSDLVTQESARVRTVQSARASEWAIAKYVVDEDRGSDGGVRYAVYRDGERVVWGLTRESVAARWIIRLGGRSPAPLEPPDAHASLEAADRAYRNRAPWWAE